MEERAPDDDSELRPKHVKLSAAVPPVHEIDADAVPGYRHRIAQLSLHWQDALTIFVVALTVRLVFSALLADTFDKNEFVYLALGRDVANGAVPYRDFAFFHPPGLLVLLGFLNPFTTLWWPAARVVDVLIDSGTAVLVWYVGQRLYGRRAALAGGLLYAVNPVVLVSAVRVNQEIPITALGMIGLTLLVTKSSQRAAVLAGACLAVACWIKYPAAVFLPVYILAAPRQARATLAGFLAAATLLFLPYARETHQLVHDTVAWQLFYRAHTPLLIRLETTAIFWLCLSPFAVAALLRGRRPAWLLFGCATGVVFIFTSSTYAPYFVPVAPYMALLGAPIAARLIRLPPVALLAACLSIPLAWAAIFLQPPARHFFAASTLSQVRPVVRFIDQTTSPGTPVLADQLEYAFLAARPWVGHYFWDHHDVVTAQYLEQRLLPDSETILYPGSSLGSFPSGFGAYLERTFSRTSIRGSTVWVGDEVADRLSVRHETTAVHG